METLHLPPIVPLNTLVPPADFFEATCILFVLCNSTCSTNSVDIKHERSLIISSDIGELSTGTLLEMPLDRTLFGSGILRQRHCGLPAK